MYERSMLMFLYADAPVHMGAGVSLGGVDLPIQRERHTDYPMAQGSGLKGALRHHLTAQSASPEEQKRATARRKITVVFGPDGDEEGRPQDHAGAAAFGDGRLLLFPVRSLIGTFAYCTSALAVGRLCRDMEVAGLSQGFLVPTPPAEGQALAPLGSKVTDSDKAFLEDFDVQVREDSAVKGLAEWIANNALPSGPAFEFFKKRVGTHLLVLDDNLFVHLVRLATVVEPHVKINDETGTAEGTAFFYAEHLPPDSVLWSLVGAGRPRLKPDPDPKSGERVDLKALELVDAAAVGQYLRDQLDGKAVQVGAEATTGRGLVHLRFASGGRDDEQRA